MQFCTLNKVKLLAKNMVLQDERILPSADKFLNYIYNYMRSSKIIYDYT